MHTPAHFPRVFLINGPIQFVLYMSVACFGYYYQGEDAQGYLLDNLPSGTIHGVASVLLFCHVAVAYLLKTIPLARCLHEYLFSADDVDALGLWPHLRACGCSFIILCLGYVVTNIVPFFNSFVGLIGALLSAPIAFALPVLLYIRAVSADYERSSQLATIVRSEASSKSADVESSHSMRSLSNLSGTRLAWYKLHSIPHLILMSLVVLFISVVMVVGTFAQIKTIIEQTEASGLPFSCHPYRPKPREGQHMS